MTKSVPRERGSPGMNTLNFEEIVKEVETQCPNSVQVVIADDPTQSQLR